MATYIIWPEEKYIDSDTIKGWYDDAVENGNIGIEYMNANTEEEMARALDNAGLITRGTPRKYRPEREVDIQED